MTQKKAYKGKTKMFDTKCKKCYFEYKIGEQKIINNLKQTVGKIKSVYKCWIINNELFKNMYMNCQKERTVQFFLEYDMHL